MNVLRLIWVDGLARIRTDRQTDRRTDGQADTKHTNMRARTPTRTGFGALIDRPVLVSLDTTLHLITPLTHSLCNC